MGVNSLPKTVTRQRRGCDLNPGRSAPESSTLTTRLPSHPVAKWQALTYFFRHCKVLFLMYSHSPSKSNAISTQILGFSLICFFPMTGHFHTYFAKNAAYVVFPSNSRLSFQRYGDKLILPSFNGLIQHV